MFSRTARKPRSERNCSGFFLCRGIIKRCTPLGSKCTPHRPFVKWYRGVKRKRLHGDNFRITVEPVIVKKYMKTLANRSFYKKKLDTNQDTHCIKIGVQLWRSGRDSNPREVSLKLISSQSRYSDFEGKRQKLTDDARTCKPLKNQHFSALEGQKSRKPRQGKEFERNPVLGRKKPVGEKMGRTRGEITVQCR